MPSELSRIFKTENKVIQNAEPIKPFHEGHSEEVHEIISSPPSWLVSWGITVSFGLIVLLGIGVWLIHYPDIVTAPFTLTAASPPRAVVAHADGRLERLLVPNGSMVTAGQHIAYLESLADYGEVILLEKTVNEVKRRTRAGTFFFVNNLRVDNFKNLGEIQENFEAFSRQLTELKAVLGEGFFQKKKRLLIKDLADLTKMEQNLKEQLEIQGKDYELAKDEFRVQEQLYNNKVISTLEFKKENSKVLSRGLPTKNIASLIIQNSSAQTAKQKEILELDNEAHERKASFLQTLETLSSHLDGWKQRFVLKAPVNGKISFSGPLQEHQTVSTGQELITVEPSTSKLQGVVKVPQANVGKLRTGQKVLIKLDGFPYREYGFVEGKLNQLSLVPGRDSMYWGYVDLPSNLQTLYERKLTYRNGMSGTAEVITDDRRLLERLLTAFTIQR